MQALTILGGGNTAFAVAANLTLRGFAVTLCEHPDFAATLEPICESRVIRLDGVAMRGVAKLHRVTTDFAEALANELVLLSVPAYAQKPFAELCAPHLRDEHVVVVTPGTLGSLEFARIVGRASLPDKQAITIAETDTAPYVCRKVAPDAAHIWGVVSGLGLGVLPATATERVTALLAEVFTVDGLNGSDSALTTYSHVLACGLSAMNPVVHPAGVLMNAGRVEYAHGEFHFYEEGVTPGVCNAIEAVDAERRAIGKALGLELTPVAEAFHRAGFGPRGDLWSVINGSHMLTQLRAPGALNTRWLTEDVPYGLAAWSLLGEQLGVKTPTMRALVDLASATLGQAFWKCARTPEQLGIGGLSADEMLKRVK